MAKVLLCECCTQAVSYDEYHYDQEQTTETKRGLAFIAEVGYLGFSGVVPPTYQQCDICNLNDGYAAYTLFDKVA